MSRLKIIKRLACPVVLICLAGMLTACAKPKTSEQAEKRLNEYADAIDYSYEEPAEIYQLLCEDFKSQMSEEEFCKAFEKERTYPYITPLYIYDPEITMAEDGMSGTAVFTQAARIEGMSYEVNFVYENGDYFIQDWDDFLDGSYLDKFEDIPYSLDWYYSN